MKILQKSALLRKLSKHLPYSLRVRIKRIAISLGKFQTDSYISWIRECDTLSEQDYRAIDRHIMALEYKPLISVIMPTYETPEWALREAIDSIKGQLYPKWELCVADDASPSLHVEKILRDAAAVDSRIRWMRRERNGNISAASNSAISLATGEFIALMDHDDVLSPRALYEVVVALNKNPRLDVIYSDEDQIDKNGQRHTPYFKTDWNIDLLLSQNMISHLGVYRRSLVEHVGGFREGFEGSQDYDLALRCADATLVDRVHHIPAILYHWRRDFGTASYSERKLEACWDAARRAIAEHLHRCNEKGRVGPHPKRPMWSRVNRMVPEPAPLVSLIVSGRDEHFLERCVSGLLYRTNYPQVELLIADQEGGSFQTHAFFGELRSDPRVRVLPPRGTLSQAAAVNKAVAISRGSILGLIRSDIDVLDGGWLAEMVSLAALPDVGAVGAKLLYPNKTVQHGGILLGLGGIAGPIGQGLPCEADGYSGRNQLTSSVSAVTSDCLVVKKTNYEEVGGFDENYLFDTLNDVDFCLKIRSRGYRNVWTPHAELLRRGVISPGADAAHRKVGVPFEEESDLLMQKWGRQLQDDPFYNQNLALEVSRCFELAFPSRRTKSWVDFI